MLNHNLNKTVTSILIYTLLFTTVFIPTINDDVRALTPALLLVTFETRSGVLKNSDEKTKQVVYGTEYGELPKMKKSEDFAKAKFD